MQQQFQQPQQQVQQPQQQFQQPQMAPPPLPGPAAPWFMGVNGQQVGPLDQNQLSQQVAAGALTASTLVWRNGMNGWVAAGQVPELAGLFGAVPPPLPPSLPPQA